MAGTGEERGEARSAVFDLDPGEGATWDAVIDGAKLVRQLLQQVQLESFVSEPRW